MKRKKVFLGCDNVAGCLTDISGGFNDLGIETITAVHDEESVLDSGKVDYNFLKDKKWFGGVRPKIFQAYLQKQFDLKKKIYQQALKECDIFVFFWRSFEGDFSDLELLKKSGKKIVVFFLGSDIRYFDSYNQEMKNYAIPSYYEIPGYFSEQMKNSVGFSLENKLLRMRKFEKYADLIFSLPNQSQLALRPYFHFYISLNSGRITENSNQSVSPIIIHAPSNRGVKGTEYVIQALDKLKKEGHSFEIKLIENIPNKEALKEYTNADIIIGELMIPSGGKLDREALAAGAISMTCMRKNYIDHIPADCPIVGVYPENIYEELKNLILDHQKRIEIAKQGRPYIEKYHDGKVIAAKILDLLETKSPDHDYYPTFYRDTYIPEKRKIIVHQQWVDSVKDCRWYKEYVRPGEREGIYF